MSDSFFINEMSLNMQLESQMCEFASLIVYLWELLSDPDKKIRLPSQPRCLPCAALWSPAGEGLFAVNKAVDRIN